MPPANQVQSQVNLQTRSGNQIAVVIGGVQVGLLQSVRMSDDYAPEPASGIGDIKVAEYVPTMARHTLSISGMVMFKGALVACGAVPENGNAVLQGLVFDVEVYSKIDGTLLRKYVGVSYASGEIEISKHQIVVQSGQFYALDVGGTSM